MPTYEYKCHSCGTIFELRQNFSDAPLTTHENCGGEVERIISAPALQFKGSGWYVTDYARGNGKTSEKSRDSGDSAKSDGGKGDSAKKDSTKKESKGSDSGSSSSSTTPSSSTSEKK